MVRPNYGGPQAVFGRAYKGERPSVVLALFAVADNELHTVAKVLFQMRLTNSKRTDAGHVPSALQQFSRLIL